MRGERVEIEEGRGKESERKNEKEREPPCV